MHGGLPGARRPQKTAERKGLCTQPGQPASCRLQAGLQDGQCALGMAGQGGPGLSSGRGQQTCPAAQRGLWTAHGGLVSAPSRAGTPRRLSGPGGPAGPPGGEGWPCAGYSRHLAPPPPKSPLTCPLLQQCRALRPSQAGQCCTPPGGGGGWACVRKRSCEARRVQAGEQPPPPRGSSSQHRGPCCRGRRARKGPRSCDRWWPTRLPPQGRGPWFSPRWGQAGAGSLLMLGPVPAQRPVGAGEGVAGKLRPLLALGPFHPGTQTWHLRGCQPALVSWAGGGYRVLVPTLRL